MLKRKCNEARWDCLRNSANKMHDKKEYKLFWNYVDSKRGGSNDFMIKLDNGNIISECMNKIFASVFTRENTENIPTFAQVIAVDSLSFLHCTTNEVAQLLKELNPRKSPGADGIHPLILKNCANSLSVSLCKIFNLSFSSGKMPDS